MTKQEFYTIENSPTFQINSKGWFLKGWSRAGLKTGFILYPFKILFDCGIYTSQKPDIIFLTHQHVDHTQAIAHICSRHKPTNTTIYLPEPSIKYIVKYERVISELSNPETENYTDDEILQHQKIKLIGVNPNDLVDIELKDKTSIQVEVLKAHHDVQSNGYGFCSWKKQIKLEYEYLTRELNDVEKTNLSNDEIKRIKQDKINKIKELKSNQIDIYEKKLCYEFAFFCDSTIANLSEHDEWKKYPVVVCECTGLDVSVIDDSHTNTESSRDYDFNHTSLLKLKPIMLANKDKKWLLIHVSLGCSEEKIKEIKDKLISEGIDVDICV